MRDDRPPRDLSKTAFAIEIERALVTLEADEGDARQTLGECQAVHAIHQIAPDPLAAVRGVDCKP